MKEHAAKNRDLTAGSVVKTLLVFMVPYLISCLMQSLYGMADLYIIGQFNLSPTITAVAVGSQFMHSTTLVIIGLASGGMVIIGHATGAKNEKAVAKAIGNTAILFVVVAAILTIILLEFRTGILDILSVPAEAYEEAGQYVQICFGGIVFVVGYNVASSIYRGLGDTRHPLYFVIITTILNILLDFIFIGYFGMGAKGAAIATVASQAVSVLLSVIFLPKVMKVRLTMEDFRPDKSVVAKIMRIGLPIAIQEGLVEVSFLVITIIANRRGVEIAAAVGIVEKVLCFLILLPVAMQVAVSALCSIYIGAGENKRCKQTLYYAIAICVIYGTVIAVLAQFIAPDILYLFDRSEPEIIKYGAQYLRSYVFDLVVVGIHFSFSGYFTAYEKPIIPFIYNIASIVTLRIPVAYFASICYPNDLTPMGMGAPLGSLLCSVIALIAFVVIERKNRTNSAAVQ